MFSHGDYGAHAHVNKFFFSVFKTNQKCKTRHPSRLVTDTTDVFLHGNIRV